MRPPGGRSRAVFLAPNSASLRLRCVRRTAWWARLPRGLRPTMLLAWTACDRTRFIDEILSLSKAKRPDTLSPIQVHAVRRAGGRLRHGDNAPGVVQVAASASPNRWRRGRHMRRPRLLTRRLPPGSSTRTSLEDRRSWVHDLAPSLSGTAAVPAQATNRTLVAGDRADGHG